MCIARAKQSLALWASFAKSSENLDEAEEEIGRPFRSYARRCIAALQNANGPLDRPAVAPTHGGTACSVRPQQRAVGRAAGLANALLSGAHADRRGSCGGATRTTRTTPCLLRAYTPRAPAGLAATRRTAPPERPASHDTPASCIACSSCTAPLPPDAPPARRSCETLRFANTATQRRATWRNMSGCSGTERGLIEQSARESRTVRK